MQRHSYRKEEKVKITNYFFNDVAFNEFIISMPYMGHDIAIYFTYNKICMFIGTI